MLFPGASRRDNKFLDQVGSSTRAQSDQSVLKCKPSSISIFLRIIKVGKTTSSETAENGRIIGLPAPIVALADHCIPECVQHAGPTTARSLVKIPGILFQDRWEDGRTYERAYRDRKSTRLNSTHVENSYAVCCLKT